ncbi:MAG: hypothetical protein RR792_06415, partial [Thermomonas sp.]
MPDLHAGLLVSSCQTGIEQHACHVDSAKVCSEQASRCDQHLVGGDALDLQRRLQFDLEGGKHRALDRMRRRRHCTDLFRPSALRLFHHLLQQAPDTAQGRIVGTALDGRREVIGICTLLPIQWQRFLRAGSWGSTSQPIAVAIAAHHDRRGRRVAINRSCGPHPEGFTQRARLQLQAMAGNDAITRCSVDDNGQPLRVCENALG